MEIALLVPVKAFRVAKGRMQDVFTPAERHALARWLATRVITGTDLPTFVACDDDEVANWATSLDADVLWSPGLGLNGAIDQGVSVIGDKGFDHVIVCHGDLPLAHNLERLVVADTVVLVPDRRLDGTNVLTRPTAVSMPAEYGRASFSRHFASAQATGLPVAVRLDRELSIDLDRIDDCRHPSVAHLIAEALPDLADAVQSNLNRNLNRNLS